MSLQCQLAASSSYGDFEACVNLLQACCTLVVTNLQTCSANLLQTKIAIWVPLKTSPAHQREDNYPLDRFNTHQAHLHGSSFVKAGFELRTLQS
ncbi:hypothetical protein AVEN_119067-1 [Araneus ventricosus]|uniref:Uncharacterized protein n=1 Tax=Araneus ventricosus TaxID=182803 RepID=A0A4Y2BN32_ARAVE|nr:hypothetical protein AVEN_119067-1 [Araneus ventricosus]